MIHTSYTVGITTGEYRALQYVMIDQKDWIENAIKNRARIASDEIVSRYTQYKINKGEAITAVGTTAVIEAAYAEGVIGIAT
jgi:ribonucleotide reductase beta subunit family protein with ferritin-like domain